MHSLSSFPIEHLRDKKKKDRRNVSHTRRAVAIPSRMNRWWLRRRIFGRHLSVPFLLTCVCVNPKLAANSARSGNARYCVRWNRRFNCCNCNELYMVLGFRIFFPLPFTRKPVSSHLSANSKRGRERKSPFNRYLITKKKEKENQINWVAFNWIDKIIRLVFEFCNRVIYIVCTQIKVSGGRHRCSSTFSHLPR